jgi:D-alanyl-D-alanine carboxypeptidase
MFKFSKTVLSSLLFLLLITVNANASSTKTKLEKVVTEYSKALEHAAVLLETTTKGARLKVAVGYADKENKTDADVDAPFPIGSASKVFVGVSVFQLIEAGKLSLDTKLNTFFPEGTIQDLAFYQGENYFNDVTVGMLLQHTSGFIDYLNIYKDDAKAIEIYTKNGDHYTFERIIKLAVDFGDANFKPGTKFSYCNTGYIILGDIIQKVSGEDWRDYVQKHILDTLGLKHTYFGSRLTREVKVNMPQGYFAGKVTDMPFTLASSAGEIVSTVDDLSTFIRAWGEGKLYKNPKTLKLQMTEGFHLMNPAILNISYGYAIMNVGGLFGHGGQTFGFQSFIATRPDANESFAIGINEAESQAMELLMKVAGVSYEIKKSNIQAKEKTAEQISSQQIANGSQVVPAPVLYRCSDKPGDVLTVYFYNQTKLPTVVINHVPDQFILYKTESGSGAHYFSDKAEFWEHHGEAIFNVEGKNRTCRVLKKD